MSQTKAQLLDNIKDNVQLDAQKALRFADSDSSNYVAFKAPATVSSNVTWTLPSADGSANYVLATDGSGNLSWIADPAGQWVTSGSNIYFTGGNVGIGDSSPSNPLSVTGASAFNGDVTFTGASYNVTWDKSVDDLIFNDNAKAAFGTSSDLTIYHDGSDSYLADTGTGNLNLLSSKAQILNAAGNEAMAKFIADGAVELYHNNVKKIETTSSGVLMPDAAQFELGAGSDLKLWHSGSNSFIRNETGNLTIEANGAGDDAIKIIPDGAVELYYDNSKKLESISWGIDCQGNTRTSGDFVCVDGGKFRAGNSSDFQMWHNGTDGVNIIDGLYHPIEIRHGAEVHIKCVDDAGVELYYNNSLKCYTNSDGFRFDDNAKLQLGSGGDLEIFHSGTKSYIKDIGTGSLRICTDDFRVYNAADNEVMIQAVEDGSVDLYHDGTKQVYTVADGIKFDDSKRVRFGSDSDAFIMHDNQHMYIENRKNNTYVQAPNLVVISSTDTNGSNQETSASFQRDGAVKLYHNNGVRLETTSEGIKLESSGGSFTPVLEINNTNAGAYAGEIRFKSYYNSTTYETAAIHSSGGSNENDGVLWFTTRNTEAFRIDKDQGFRLGVTSAIDQEKFSVSTGSSPNAYFHQTASADLVNLVLRHGRGLSGYEGNQVIFKRNDATNVGSIKSGASGTSYNTSSDYRLKENQVLISDGITRLKKLKPYRFNFKDEPSRTVDGFFAHEVSPSVPEAVSGIKDAMEPETRYEEGDTIPSGKSVGDPKTFSSTKIDPQQIDQAKLVPLLTAALQEAITKIETLETKVAALESA